MKYQIELKECSFWGYHGVLESERQNGQKFLVDAFLLVDANVADDDISGTVNYAQVFELIENIMTGEAKNLIETLAFEIAESVLSSFAQVEQAKITIVKPNAPIEGDFGHVSVTVSLPQEAL